jgi:hypothetical protein
MNRRVASLTITFIALVGGQALAVELLIPGSGGFEATPASTSPPGWNLQETFTASALAVDTATLITGSADTAPSSLWLRAFVGNGPSGVAQGNYENDSLPAGDVDGNDFLVWQRGGSPTPNSPVDLTTWRNNFGRISGLKANAVLTQTVAATPGENYTFKGSSRWEANYSGGVATLDEGGPLGAVPSPTSTTLEIAFLNAGGAVIGSPVVKDLRTEQFNINFWAPHTLNAVAPAGTAQVRVTAAARDMVWNGAATLPNPGALQSAFFDSFGLSGAAAPATELLTNPALDVDPPTPPTGLEPWTVTQNDPAPVPTTEIVRTAGFANHTGTTGVWFSSFFGEYTNVGGPGTGNQLVDGKFSQSAAATPGGSYTFSGWSKWESGYSGGVDTLSVGSGAGLPSPTQTQMELAFLDASDAVIGSPIILDVKAARKALINPGNPAAANPNDNNWYQHSLNGVAPAGTVKVRVAGIMLQGIGNANPQSAFFDDFSLMGPGGAVPLGGPVPEPATAAGFALIAAVLGAWRPRRSA